MTPTDQQTQDQDSTLSPQDDGRTHDGGAQQDGGNKSTGSGGHEQ